MPSGSAQDDLSPQAKPPFSDRLRGFFLKPAKPGTLTSPDLPPLGADELEDAVRYATDKERVIGLIAAPIAAAIGILIISALISNDPAALLKNGQPNKLHVSVTLYHELTVVLVVLSLLMLGMAMWRKRLFLGIVMALYGLTVFNLHYWGFGVPFIMCAAWLLVRSYRFQRDLREATGERPPRPGSPYLSAGTRPRPSKRYTPPASSPRR